MKRTVGLLEVADEATWDAVRAAIPLDDHVVRWRDGTSCFVDGALRDALPALASRGIQALVRSARAAPAAPIPTVTVPPDLSAASVALLHRAQRHALDGRVALGVVFDPEHEIASARAVYGAGLLVPDPAVPGFATLHPRLPPPPPPDFDPSEAWLERPDDLGAPKPGPLALLHDAASLAAALGAVRPRRVLAGTLARTDEKRVAEHLGVAPPIESSERWGRAFRALTALRVVETDLATREVLLDLGLETVLEGDVAAVVDALLRRLIEPDVHPLMALVRASLRSGEAVDDVVFLDLVREQQRTSSFWPWTRDGREVYPGHPEVPFDDQGFQRVEGRMVSRLLDRLEFLGVVVRAPGVFAPTDDGAAWAGGVVSEPSPVWVTGDLAVVVPPGAVTPWERFQLERLARCLARDRVDRYRLERPLLERWLATHDVEEALGWLARRAPGLPAGVVDTLRGWARSATRVVWWDGVVEEADPPG